ncbi:MAG: hypothetical protein J6T35_08145, partial [Bacteroidales bacterium]|nr:hypothetical protein [Bacteroidales bacterium]
MASVRFRHIVWLWLALLWCAGPEGLRAQSESDARGRIEGEVRDNETGEPLSGVVLRLDGGYIWTVSDEKGRFVLTKVPDGK